jgi:hypothetical protein
MPKSIFFFQHRCFKNDVSLTIHRKNLLTSGVTFGNKPDKLGTHSYECKMLLGFIL